jgi:acetyl esterase/lipase
VAIEQSVDPMSISLFLLAVVSAWFACNLEWPVYRHKWGFIASFAFGWLVGELAPFVVAGEVLLALLILAGHDVSGVMDTLSLLLLVLSWYGMLRYTVAAGDADEVMEAALRRALGNDYRLHIDPALTARFPAAVPVRALARPFRLDLPEVTRVMDIAYGEEQGFVLGLDVYHHRDKPAGCPVLFQIHGGGWTEKMGSKNEQARPLMNHMAARGWVCVSVDYRLSPAATFPAHIVDCKRALAWVKANIPAYGGDPGFVVATGGSAGGHLSALLALSANDPDYQPGFEDADTRVQGCVPFYGVYDLTDHLGLKHNQVILDALADYIVKASYRDAPEIYERGSPIRRVHAEAPPFLVIHGDKDSLCPLAEARAFAQRLEEVSAQPVAYAEIPGAQHAFDIFRSLRSELVMYGVERFLAFLYSAHRGTRAGS